MGQEEIYQLLKKHDKWMCIRRLAIELDQSRSAVTIAIGKLLKLGYVERRMGTHHLYNIKQFEFKWIK